jgi:O-antigen ligase
MVFATFATVQAFGSGGKVFWTFETGYETLMGTIPSPNHFAALIEAVLPIALYRALRTEREALPYLAMSAVMLASVIASGSRAGTILTLAEVVAVFALARMRGRVSTAQVFGALGKLSLLFAIFVVVVGWQHVWEKFMAPDPMAVRREFNLSTVAMIRANPWFGVGLGNWPTAYPRFAIVDVGTFANQAHNDWLQWAAEGGIPFALALATIFIWALRTAFSSIWGIGVISVFLHAVVDYPFSRPALGSWPILVMGMLACLPSDASASPRGGRRAPRDIASENKSAPIPIRSNP